MIKVQSLTLFSCTFQNSAESNRNFSFTRNKEKNMAKVRVNSEKVKYTETHIEAQYDYETTRVEVDTDGSYVATPQTTQYTFQTQRKVCRI